MGSGYEFPFVWADPMDAERHWVTRAVDGRAHDVMPPLELDVRARWGRTFGRAAFVTGRQTGTPRVMEVNGRQYWHYPPRDASAPKDPLREQVGKSFEQLGERLCARGENYLDAVTFPEMREGNRRLAAVAVDEVAPGELAGHLVEALDWIERGWTLHWARPEANPAARFARLYKELTGDESPEASRLLLSYEPNKMTEAVDGIVGLARIAQAHPALREWLGAREAEAVVSEMGSLGGVEGGAEFVRELEALLDPERQGLRCGSSWGVEQNQCMPGWREVPALVIGLVQKYLPLDLDALDRAREEAIARRDARVGELRASIEDEERRREFDFWLEAGKQAVRAQEDHNYLIDSATMSLAHRAIMASGRRLAGAGLLACAEDVWWLREHQVVAALHGLGASEALEAPGNDGAAPTPTAPVGQWQQLVEANKALYEWQRTLTPPETLGAPPPAPRGQPAPPKPPAAGEPEPEPAALLVKGQRGSAGTRTGRVRIVRHDAPDAEMPQAGPDDVLVARHAGALWGPLAPAVGAVVLEVGSPFMHVMCVCREYGVPGIVNARGALEKLRDGQRVTVNGEKGWILAEEEPETP